MPTCSVLIPSHARLEALRACLAGLARQTTPPHDVLVGLDGGTARDAETIEHEHRGALAGLRVFAMPRTGYIPVRRALLERAGDGGGGGGGVFLSLNDDVVPGERLIEAHLARHEEGPAIVTGSAPWKRPERPTRFDDLVARTDLIFFDPERAVDRHGRLPYRYCVGLNFSCPMDLARKAGGFHDLPRTYGYDDIEFAWRISRHAGCPIRYAPDALVVHDHRYTPLGVMRREYQLGRAAFAYSRANPEFCLELFGRDVASARELAFCDRFLREMRPDAQRIERRFCAHGDIDAGERPLDDDTLAQLAEHWVLLKRYLWRWGLLDASAGIEPRFAPLAETGELP